MAEVENFSISRALEDMRRASAWKFEVWCQRAGFKRFCLTEAYNPRVAWDYRQSAVRSGFDLVEIVRRNTVIHRYERGSD